MISTEHACLRFSIAQARRADDAAQKRYLIPVLLLMENAGRSVAEETLRMIPHAKSARPPRILIAAGKGNNGGDGLCAARHLVNRNAVVSVWLSGIPKPVLQAAWQNYRIAKRMQIPIRSIPRTKQLTAFRLALQRADLLIDALFGVGLSRQIERPAADIIQAMNDSKKPILSVDIPSGLDADSGNILGTCIRAKKTVSLAVLKRGCYLGRGPAVCGKVVLGDISIPNQLIQKMCHGKI